MLTLSFCPENFQHVFRFYVVRDSEGVAVYVNTGKIGDILSLKALIRNPEFNLKARYIIETHGEYQSQREAENAMGFFIRDKLGNKMPRLNMSIIETRQLCIKCDQTGIVYRNASEAARVMGLDQSRLSMHLNRRAGHKTIKGFTFSHTPERPTNWNL